MDLSDDREESSPKDRTSWQEEGGDHQGDRLGRRWLEGERNRSWSESVFEMRPYIAKLDMSDMSHGWIRHVRRSKT
jgi:hypothetical protein